jgi:F-type H+-transporting ATPase subunit a
MHAEPPFLLSPLTRWLDARIGQWIPINDTVVMTWIVMIIIVVLAILSTQRLRKIPTGLQNIVELLVEELLRLAEQLMGKNATFFLPLMGTLAIFIVISNFIGLIPGLKAPTSDWNTTIAMALIIFFSTHFFGIKQKGLINYLKHFVAPCHEWGWWIWLTPLPYLLFLIHLMGEFAKPFSLSIRLFINMMSKHLILGVLALLIVLFSKDILLFLKTLLIPIFLPPFVMVLGVLTCIVQTFIFVALSMVYIGMATAEEEI